MLEQMYGMQPNAYAQYAGYPGYQAYGQPAAPGAAVAPGGTPQQVSLSRKEGPIVAASG
jgi:hypothetical protein